MQNQIVETKRITGTHRQAIYFYDHELKTGDFVCYTNNFDTPLYSKSRYKTLKGLLKAVNKAIN
jgi:hypothetical protein